MQHRDSSHASLHFRIDYLLTEARVVLPGAQAMLGFQFIATLTGRFAALPSGWRVWHYLALGLIAISVLLLIAPAALHRIAFAGEDDERFLKIGSRIVTFALLPLAIGVAADLALATFVIFGRPRLAGVVGVVALIALVTVWFVLPWLYNRRRKDVRAESQAHRSFS